MVFSSNIFLFLFLPITLLVYYALHKRFRNVFLLVSSLLFYAYGEPKFIIVLLILISFSYLMALIISQARNATYISAKTKCISTRVLLSVALAGNLSVLFIYKYLDFAIGNLNHFGFNIPFRNLVLPIGISFFTFQAISYIIDVYRGTAEAQKKPWNVALYIAFFPQFIAGPIVRYTTIEENIRARNENLNDFSLGVKRFVLGLSKKILLANNMALIADKAFSTPDAERSILVAWVGIIAYSFQILFDFSGYSEMAIGLGKMFGFHFNENFNYPYMSKSVSEFWRRWHISLGEWFRDYVYFPLGGSRVSSKRKLIFNLFVVWLLTGIWHGASWNFIIWGLMYFALIAFEKLTGYPDKLNLPFAKMGYRILTMLAVLFGWVLFRAEGLSPALDYIVSMFGGYGNRPVDDIALFFLREYWVFLLFCVLCSTTVFKAVKDKLKNSLTIIRNTFAVLTFAIYSFLLIYSISFIFMGSYNPFIYFNF